MIKEIYDIGGMHCAACSGAVERVTRKLPGVRESSVNLMMNRMTIEYDESKVTPEIIVQKIEKAGFTAVRHEDNDSVQDVGAQRNTGQLRRLVVMLCLAFADFGIAMTGMFGLVIPIKVLAIIELLLTIPVLVLGKHFFSDGFKSLFHGNPNMDTLVALSAAASCLYSLVVTCGFLLGILADHPLYYESAAMVIALVSLGKYLESRSSEKTRDAVRKLRSYAPETAWIEKDGEQREVSVAEIRVGDIVRIRTGMSVPVDGIIVDGWALLDESMLTGEIMPVSRRVGEHVIGGSIAVDGAFALKAENVGSDTLFSRIVKYVEDAQGQKASIARIADKVAGVFVPSVLAVAVIAAVVWLICGQSIPFVLNIFTSVLVIACPCAMGLATPTAIIVGTGLGAAHGILIRSGAALELTHRVKTVVFDKTGTLTEGSPQVTDVIARDTKQVLSLALALENNVAHPIAKAICCYAQEQQANAAPIHDYRSMEGRGLFAFSDQNEPVYVGSLRLMQENQIDVSPFENEIGELQQAGKTVVCVALNSILIGILAVTDTLRSDAGRSIQALESIGIRTVMITGDHEKAASSIAKSLGLKDFRASILPTQKADAIREIQENGGRVMMVGDGINDAPALAQADVGCAIGSGSDIAMDCAQIVLIRNQVMDVVRAIALSRQTMKKIKQNLFWAFGYNILGIPVAAGVFYPSFGVLLVPMVCAAAMCLSSLFVVTNALSLRRYQL